MVNYIGKGSNIFVGTDPDKIIALSMEALNGKWKKCAITPFWDSKASGRIVDSLGKTYF